MAIARINGGMLQSILERTLIDLSITSNAGTIAYFSAGSLDPRLGINNTSPSYTLDITGNAHLGNLYILGNTITTDSGKKLNLGNINNVQITGGSPNYILYTDGAGTLNFGNLSQLATLEVFTGNNIILGTNTAGVLSGNAGNFTTQTSVTDSIAVLNQILGNVTNSGGNLIHVSGNVVAGNVVSNLYGQLVGNVTGNMTGNLTGSVLTATQPYITSLGTLTSLAVAANITSGNVVSNFYGNLYGSVATASQPYITSLGTLTSLAVAANVTGGNVVSNFYGNLYGNVVTASQPYITSLGNLSNLTVLANVTAGNVISNHYGNVRADLIGSLATSVTVFNTTTAVGLPAGTNAQYPTANVAGYFRYNTSASTVEFYNGSAWIPFTNTISDQQVTPDGVTAAFTLNTASSAEGLLVSINGTVQRPGIAYTVTGTTITFAEVPAITDIIDIRYIASATSVILTGIASDISTTGNISASKLTLTSALQFANLTTAQVTAITGPSPGMTVYNYTTGNIQVYNGTKWANVTLS